MSAEKKRDIAHSIFQKLKNYAKAQNADFNLVLFRYGLERFLYRLCKSDYSDKFILKGANLFVAWQGQNFRVTRDADFLYYGQANTEYLVSTLETICGIDFRENDGIVFLQESVKAETIRDTQEYGGTRITLTGMLSQAKIPLQIDIGIGDIITPGPDIINFPTILDLPAPTLKAYPRYTVVAEKFEAIVSLGIANSRMKDFYDIWLLSTLFEFDGEKLSKAIQNTLTRRKTNLPDNLPIAFTDEFKKDPLKTSQWKAFIRKSKPDKTNGSLDFIICEIEIFLLPILKAVKTDEQFLNRWKVDKGWYAQ